MLKKINLKRKVAPRMRWIGDLPLVVSNAEGQYILVFCPDTVVATVEVDFMTFLMSPRQEDGAVPLQ